VTGVQTCALPISEQASQASFRRRADSPFEKPLLFAA